MSGSLQDNSRSPWRTAKVVADFDESHCQRLSKGSDGGAVTADASQGIPPPGAILEVRKGETVFGSSDDTNGWRFGQVGVRSGWFPASAVVFEQLDSPGDPLEEAPPLPSPSTLPSTAFIPSPLSAAPLSGASGSTLSSGSTAMPGSTPGPTAAAPFGTLNGPSGTQIPRPPLVFTPSDDLSSSDPLASGLSGLALDSRKNSQFSTSSAGTEPTEGISDIEEEVDIAHYKVIETVDYPAVWVPYHDRNQIVYLDTQRQVLAKSLPFTAVDASVATPQQEICRPSEPCSLGRLACTKPTLAPKPCLYKNSDFYSAIPTHESADVVDLDNLWTQMVEDVAMPYYGTWTETMQGFLEAVDRLGEAELKAKPVAVSPAEAMACSAERPPEKLFASDYQVRERSRDHSRQGRGPRCGSPARSASQTRGGDSRATPPRGRRRAAETMQLAVGEDTEIDGIPVPQSTLLRGSSTSSRRNNSAPPAASPSRFDAPPAPPPYIGQDVPSHLSYGIYTGPLDESLGEVDGPLCVVALGPWTQTPSQTRGQTPGQTPAETPRGSAVPGSLSGPNAGSDSAAGDGAPLTSLPSNNPWSTAREPDDPRLAVAEAFAVLVGHLHFICRAAHVPPGTHPALEFGALAMSHRLMLNSALQLYVLKTDGRPAAFLEELTESTMQFVTLFQEATGASDTILDLPRRVALNIMAGEWIEATLDTTSMRVGPPTSDVTVTSSGQLLPLEGVYADHSLCGAIESDLAAKKKVLFDSIAKCLRLWDCVRSVTARKADDNVNEHGMMLFASLHSVAAIYKSVVNIMDCCDLRKYYSGPSRSLEDLLTVLAVKRVLFRALFEFEDSWFDRNAAPRNGTVVAEYATVIANVPELQAALDSLVEIIQKMNHQVEGTRLARTAETGHTVVFDRHGALRGATKRLLVEQLTLHETPRPQEQSAFLATFPAYMDHIELVDLLEDRFSVQPDRALSEAEHYDWEAKVQRPIRLRVVNLLRMWLENFWSEPDSDSARRALYLRLDLLLRTLENQQCPGTRRLSEVLSRRRSAQSISSSVRTSHASVPLPEPLMPRDSAEPLTPIDVPALELARQLTMSAHILFSHVTREDCLRRALERPPVSAAISDFVAHWNSETCWVSQEVLEGADPAGRAEIIMHFIEVARLCSELNNYSSMMAIISALYSAGIHRLKSTWALVTAEARSELDKMNRIMNSSRNFTEYRDLLSLITGPAVPFFGVCLMDLRFAQDGNSDYVDGDTRLVNFAKWSMVATIIDTTLRFQQSSYRLLPVERIMHMLRVGMASPPSLNEQYALSLACEPRLGRERMSSMP